MPDSDDDGRKASPKARLRKTLIDEVQGKRTCVLVLGDGVNLQSGEPWEEAAQAGGIACWKRSGEKLKARQTTSTDETCQPYPSGLLSFDSGLLVMQSTAHGRSGL